MVVGGVMYAMAGGSEGDNPLVFLGPVVMIANTGNTYSHGAVRGRFGPVAIGK
jgi:hypothetical protein